MQAQASGHLLAQDEHSQLLGVISLDRLWAEFTVSDLLQAHTLADLLPLPRLRVTPATPRRQVATLMANHPGHCSVVLAAARDLLTSERAIAAPADLPLGMITPEALCQVPVDAPCTAATLMIPIPLTLPSQTSLADVWSTLQRETSASAVVTETDEWVGMVTALDLLRVFTPEFLYQRVQALARSLTVQTAALAQEQADRSQIEARFHEITSLISQVFFIRSITGEFLYISPAYESLWGRSRAHLYQQIISSLLSLQAHRVQDATAYEALAESRNRISTMALIHEHLYRSQDLTHIRFANYVEQLVTSIFDSYALLAQRITFQILIDPDITIHLEQSVTLGLILNELVNNAIQHAFLPDQSGKIIIQLETNVAHAFTLTVRDNGQGLPTDFDWETIQSMGLKLVQILTEQMSGNLEIQPRHPTQFKITFPAKPSIVEDSEQVPTKARESQS